ncbi:BIG GRAIN 1-like protein A [Tanacetum coccineum]
MNIPERNSYRNAYQPPHRRKTPSFSSSLLDSILRSIDETNEHVSQQQLHDHNHDHDHDVTFAYEPKVMNKINVKKSHLINEGVEQRVPSLRRVIMIDQWMETHNNNNNNNNNNSISYCNGNSQYNSQSSTDCYIPRKSTRKCSSDSISSGTTFTTSSATSEQTETPSTYRSLPNSFTISRKTADAVFRDEQKGDSKREGKFMKSTKLRAMKIYGDLKKAKQPISPGSRISAFLHSLFASSKKAKIEESIQNFRTLKKSRSIKQDTTMSCTSFSRSCMSKKQHSNGVKRSVRFYPETETVDVTGRKSNTSERDEKYERRWFTEKSYVRNYRNFMVEDDMIEDENENEENEDDLFELQIIGGYGQELPVFETTDLRKIRI